jgi:glycosyltransferase involved in cell wall biosynthesis
LAQLDPSLDARLELVGGGEQEHHLSQLAHSLGVADRVTISGYVTDEQLADSLHRAAVFAMPSIAELQSIATMEAMSNGLPVVGADAMALPHLVHDGENGYLFEPDNVDEFADRLTDVLTAAPEEYMRMARESLRIVEAHDIQKTVSTFEAIYRGEKVTDTIKEPIRERSLRGSLAKVREKLSRGVDEASVQVREKLGRASD